jgi:ankyrin repeat protein
MNYRRSKANKAHVNTCGWIFKHPSYRQWIGEQRGFLWIEGNPGAGKSTLLAATYEVFRKPETKEGLCLDFFFHGQGTSLQKSSIGMFRSILYQLFQNDLASRKVISHAYKEKKVLDNTGTVWEWQLAELQDLCFTAILNTAKTRKVNLFVDALDEAGTDVPELVDYFRRLNDHIIRENATARICISCRHYPVTARIPGHHVSVEHNNGADISSYVQAMLQSKIRSPNPNPDTNTWYQVQQDLINRASGIFQWAHLAVRMVLDSFYEDGASWSEIFQMLGQIPEELGHVYEYILGNIIKPHHRKKTLHLVQWICLAERPLSVTELRYAMGCDDEYTLHSQEFPESDSHMERLIQILTGGLAEVKQYGSGNIVQFIHQTVNDFLLSRGLMFLVPQSSTELPSHNGLRLTTESEREIIGRSQSRLCKSCINYLKCPEIQHELSLRRKQGWIRGLSFWDYKNLREGSNLYGAESWTRHLPFLEYAAKSWFLHAQEAESNGFLQKYLIKNFEDPPELYQDWVMLYNAVRGERAYEVCGSHLLSFAAGCNLQSVVRGFLEQGKSVEVAGENGDTALLCAARYGHNDLIAFLLEAKAEVDVENAYAYTPLEVAAEGGHQETVKLLLKNGSAINKALQAAAQTGNVTLVKTLLDGGADVNACDSRGATALHYAAWEPHEAIVHLLLDYGADIHIQGGENETVLQNAALGGHKEVVALLLENGADVNVQGGSMGNALAAAAYEGSKEIVELLLHKGALVNAKGGGYNDALQRSAFNGHEYGTEVRERLSSAVGDRAHISELAELLLHAGVEVKAKGQQYCNVLRVAASKATSQEVKAVIELLLSKEIEIEGKNDTNNYGTALQAAAAQGHQEIVEMLLDHGAEVNSTGQMWGSPLRAAAWNGLHDIVEVLLRHGAAYRAENNEQEQMLKSAASKGHKAVAKVMVDMLARKTELFTATT